MVLAFCVFSHAQSPEDREAVLAVNEAFYKAFRESDMKAMARIWGHQEPIAVAHPASSLIRGRVAVLGSWAQILLAPPLITCAVESVRFKDERWAVICQENLRPGTVRMINVFHLENGLWRMIYHGPAPAIGVAS